MLLREAFEESDVPFRVDTLPVRVSGDQFEVRDRCLIGCEPVIGSDGIAEEGNPENNFPDDRFNVRNLTINSRFERHGLLYSILTGFTGKRARENKFQRLRLIVREPLKCQLFTALVTILKFGVMVLN